MKKLNKPEMLLLNHLKTQINYYYPEKMNKHIRLPSAGGLDRSFTLVHEDSIADNNLLFDKART